MVEDRKIYTSFHDIPPREYMYFPKGTMEIEKPGRFSRTEITHLIISMTVLTFAFAFALGSFNLFSGFNINSLTTFIPISFLGIVTAFFFHELSHKLTAQKFGLWAEYRMFPKGLLIAILLSFTGFVFAAPGAVMFRGESRTHETGKIAAAGPTANIIIALIALPVYLVVLYEDATIIGTLVGFICLINAFLATFNLLPFGPLDGTKVIRWNINIWFILLITSILLLVTILQFSPLFNF